MLDVRRCRIVAVYASVGDGVYGGYESGGGSGDGIGGEQSRGVCRIREILGEGKERKRAFLLFIGRFVGVGER